MIAKKRLSIKSLAATPKRGGASLSRPVKSSEKIRMPTSSDDGPTALARKTIYYVYGINGIEKKPRAVSPSNPIEQANGFCHRTHYPWSTRGLRRSRQISFRTEDVAGRINPRDFRRNFLGGRRRGAPETHRRPPRKSARGA